MRWLLVMMLSVAPAAAAVSDWQPERTLAFIVGVLKWQRDFDPFPKKGRRDAELVRELTKRGVPAERLVYLKDKQATLAAIRARFKELLKQSKAGDLLLFYYCGHGFQDSGKTYLANVDAGDAKKSWWPAREVIDAIERDFRGRHALVLADCCHSGALVDEVRKRSGRLVSYGVITSAVAENGSTGNWTFSQSVLDALRGEAAADADGDKAVTVVELASYADAELQAFDKQRAASVFTEYFPASMKLGAVPPGPRPERAGERVQVKYEGEWWAAKIVKVEGKQALIRWIQIGYDRAKDAEWVPLKTVRPLK
jgi:hypothetical protein